MSATIEVGDVHISLASIAVMEVTVDSRNVIRAIKVVTTAGVSYEFDGHEAKIFVESFSQALGITVAEARARLVRK